MGSLDAKYPWLSTVNVANFVTVKPCLEEKEEERLTNFNIWGKQIHCLLEGQGVLGFINGRIAPPEEANTVPEESSNIEYEKELWRRTDSLVKGWILGSIGKDALDTVWELETARDVWLKLEEIFNFKEIIDATYDEEAAEVADEEGVEDDNKSSETGGDINSYVPLYKAALRGDWDTAKDFFKDKKLLTAVISRHSRTALHVAVSTGKANDFVNKLVELMPPDALALKDSFGYTALHTAARVGNREAAMVLVNKNEDLLYILENQNFLPATIAAVCGQKETLEDLISRMESKPNVEHKPFEGELGIALLVGVIDSELFDVALDLVEKYPHLARLKHKFGSSALSPLADKNSAFPSGERFNWWQKLIYRRIPLKQPKKRAGQATSVARDIENASGDAPVDKYSSSFQKIFGGKYLSSIAQYSFL